MSTSAALPSPRRALFSIQSIIDARLRLWVRAPSFVYALVRAAARSSSPSLRVAVVHALHTLDFRVDVVFLVRICRHPAGHRWKAPLAVAVVVVPLNFSPILLLRCSHPQPRKEHHVGHRVGRVRDSRRVDVPRRVHPRGEWRRSPSTPTPTRAPTPPPFFSNSFIF